MLAILLIGGCSAPEAPAPERPALRFAHNLWPGYFPITLARELGYYAREGVAVEVIYTEDHGAPDRRFHRRQVRRHGAAHR